MISTFSFSYPWWYLIFCLLAGAAYAVAMYRKEDKFQNYSPWFKRLLAFLRGTSVFFISLLLLSPFIKMVLEETKRPMVILATDQSASIGSALSRESSSQWSQKVQELKTKLSDKFETTHLRFGDQVYVNGADSFQLKSTNISQLFQYIEDNYSDQNLGAVILATDGIYNEGANPQYQAEKIKSPVYTIALGDTTQKKDVYVQQVLYNRIAYLGDQFPIQVDISAFQCSGSTIQLTLEQITGKSVTPVATETINLASKTFFTTKTFLVTAGKPGIARYRVRAGNVAGEWNTANNNRDIFIEILDGRQKILLLANAPHPDLGALKAILSSNKNYEAEITFIKDLKDPLSKYSLVFLHNLPSENADIQGVLSQLDKFSIPRIFIVGMQTSLPKFNKAQQTIAIAGNSRNNEEIQGEFNSGFSLFTTSDVLKSTLKSFPPLLTPFGEYKLQGAGSVYLYQNIKKIKTNYPLITFDEQNGIKTAVICGEGIWKWRLFDYLQHENHDLVNELVGKTVQLTSVKSDKRKFRASTSKNIYKENEVILFDAQLYNEGYEMINEPDVQLSIKDETGKEYPFSFNRIQNYYSLDAGLFSQGSYSYTASTNYNGKVLTTTGTFSVEAIQLEQFDLTARHGLLKSISEQTGGFLSSPQNLEALADSLLQNTNIKPVLYESKSTRHIIELKWLFFLILGLLSSEWFLRRYFGSY
ncbi:MAG: hypothetical protein LW630_03475 [Saprospiraceae bacterium]|nr:hypothetical protein [Saprospiraceae bacterium]